METIYGMHKLVGLQLFGIGTPTFSSGTPTFCQMGVLNSCFQNPSESSALTLAFIFAFFFKDNSQALDNCIRHYLTFIYRGGTLLTFGLSLHLICYNIFVADPEGVQEVCIFRGFVPTPPPPPWSKILCYMKEFACYTSEFCYI